MNSEEATKSAPLPTVRREVVFTPAQANRALVLVRRIVGDIVTHHGRLMDLRSERHEASAALAARPRVEQLQEEIDAAIDELNRLHDELTSIGCVLKDWAVGLVDFPAMHEGRMIWLCWKLGEEAVTHWHEWNTGYGGRRPIGADFE